MINGGDDVWLMIFMIEVLILLSRLELVFGSVFVVAEVFRM